MIKEYFLRTVRAQAIQWDGTNVMDISSFLEGNIVSESDEEPGFLLIYNSDLKGRPTMVGMSDFIIKNRMNEFSVIEENSFKFMYEEIEL